jgi:peroxiredoxin Q/BCP
MRAEILNFKLQADNDKEYTLNDFKGKNILLYFYPKDDTPGCTTQACDFTRLYDMYEKAGYTIIGVSKDSPNSHLKFKNKYQLKHLLLSDPELILHKEFCTYGEKKLYGKTVQGVIRSTFLIDNDLTIIKEFKNVRAKGHAERILKEL